MSPLFREPGVAGDQRAVVAYAGARPYGVSAMVETDVNRQSVDPVQMRARS